MKTASTETSGTAAVPGKRLSSDSRVLLRVGALAGLTEGLAIARYDVLMGDLDRLFGAVFWVLILAAVSLAAWALIGNLALRFLRSPWRVLASFALWTAVVAIGRSTLDDRLTNTTWILIGVGVALAIVYAAVQRAAVTERASWLVDLGVIFVSAGALFGRVPNQSHPALYKFWFLTLAGLLAWALVSATRRWKWLVFALPALALCLGLAAGLKKSSADGPNVLWILVDTVRRDHVQPYDDKVHTPAIARLAQEGVTFHDAVTVVPKTPASVASFFTGRYPTGHGVRSLHDRLPEDQNTAAEAFRRAGYNTAAFINNGWINRGRGFERGFERFMAFFEIHRPYGPLRYLSWLVAADQVSAKRIPHFSAQTSSALLTNTTLQYLQAHRERPFFAYVHYFEPHWPYFPPKALAERYGAPEDGRVMVNYIGQTDFGRGRMIFDNPLPEAENEVARRLYRGEIDNTMANIGRLIEGLEALGLADNTIVAFTADHGHSLGEHDYYFHHGEFLYEASMRIPLILRWPSQLPAGLEVEGQVRSIDLAPTLLELAAAPALGASDGESLKPFWTESGVLPRPAYLETDVKMFFENTRRAFSGIPGKLRGLRDGRFKLILTPGQEGVDYELFDVVADPDESVNLVEDPAYSAIYQALRAQLARLIPAQERAQIEALGGAIGAPSDQEMSEEEVEMLRSLGYLQ